MTKKFLKYIFRGDNKGEYRHFTTACILTLALGIWGVPALIAAALVFTAGFILECLPFNHFYWWDIAYNGFGVIAALLIFCI